ncbi:MAG: hypothetical protein H6706_29600 [Myxococcales bacterium]|nr:hypothetical protein [Myxococcales bacterium]
MRTLLIALGLALLPACQTSLQLRQHRVAEGYVVGQTGRTLELLHADGTRERIPIDAVVEARAPAGPVLGGLAAFLAGTALAVAGTLRDDHSVAAELGGDVLVGVGSTVAVIGGVFAVLGLQERAALARHLEAARASP